MELSKLKYLQCYMTSFEIYFRQFGRHPKRDQLYIILPPSMEIIFETIETADIYMNTFHSIIETIFNRKFGNKLQHQNGPNQRQHTHKNTSQKYQRRNTRQQYQYRNTGQQHQYRNNSQQYHTRSFQTSRT